MAFLNFMFLWIGGEGRLRESEGKIYGYIRGDVKALFINCLNRFKYLATGGRLRKVR